ncbi:MAG TPA: amidohydrolase [Vitreimonas sp.]|uniref:amidohydrolase n=1 Tax=Vitreimonas sp. TaxID=3069702 RepID=UPI002D379DC3|nr:amidohydrolase [Vitreimonas sp.]HYD87774.1 amidohydrolase [Vitreimonas sp.]
MATMNRRTLALAALAAGCAPSGARAEDVIIHGGPIYTGVEAAPRAEAVRISGGRFMSVGSLADARNGRRAREIDLAGAAAFPGFTDSHVHLTGVGMAAMVLDLVGVVSIAELQQRLRDYARTHPEGAIYGRGWIETHWPERRFPNRTDLDAVVGDRPVFLERIDGHAAVVNSAGLALAGIDANTANPAGGAIERDGAGAATGMLIDNATALVQSRLPAPTPAMIRQAIAEGARIYASRGWTGIANMSTSLAEAQIFEDLARAGELPLRADIYLTPEDSEVVMQRGPYGEGLVRVRGVKLYMDGALGSRGAALLAPYSDAPTQGLLVTPVDELRALLTRARQARVQVATHAIGDRGNRLVLDAYRDTFADDPAALRAARWRIEHAQVVASEDISRFAAQGVIASMQPSHAISDLHFAPARLGPDRLAGAYAWRALLDSGATIAAGSDAPVEKGDPLIEFYAASHRHDLSGFAGPDWRADEAVSRGEALRMLTSAGAFACFAEAQRGAIAPGMRADLSAFSGDLMTAAPADIPRARAVLAVSDGRVTHEAL